MTTKNHCTVCGAELVANAPFCTSCGARVTATPATGPTVALPGLPDPALPGGSRTGDPMWSPPPSDLAPPPSDLAPPPASPTAALGSGSNSPYTPTPYAPPQATIPANSYAPATAPTSTSAIVSLVFGILGWVVLPIIGPIIAVIAGHMARGEIRRSESQLQGGGLALAGLILGYLQIGLALIGCVLFVLLLGIGAMSGGR